MRIYEKKNNNNKIHMLIEPKYRYKNRRCWNNNQTKLHLKNNKQQQQHKQQIKNIIEAPNKQAVNEKVNTNALKNMTEAGRNKLILEAFAKTGNLKVILNGKNLKDYNSLSTVSNEIKRIKPEIKIVSEIR